MTADSRAPVYVEVATRTGQDEVALGLHGELEPPVAGRHGLTAAEDLVRPEPALAAGVAAEPVLPPGCVEPGRPGAARPSVAAAGLAIGCYNAPSGQHRFCGN